MSIDWEFILDCEGDDLQDTYDSWCGEEDPWSEDDDYADDNEPPPPASPIPAELHDQLAQRHMIQRRQGCPWEPTAYGRSLGIINGCLPQAEGGVPGQALFIPDNRKAELDQALAWPPALQESEGPRSWAQSMERVSQGFSCSDTRAASIVQAFGAIPLSQYIEGSPEELLCLKLGLSENATYQEAAGRVYQICVESERTAENDEYCMDLIFALTAPLYSVLKAMRPPAF